MVQENIQLIGYQIYAVEKWCASSHLTCLHGTYTGSYQGCGPQAACHGAYRVHG